MFLIISLRYSCNALNAVFQRPSFPKMVHLSSRAHHALEMRDRDRSRSGFLTQRPQCNFILVNFRHLLQPQLHPRWLPPQQDGCIRTNEYILTDNDLAQPALFD